MAAANLFVLRDKLFCKQQKKNLINFNEEQVYGKQFIVMCFLKITKDLWYYW